MTSSQDDHKSAPSGSIADQSIHQALVTDTQDDPKPSAHLDIAAQYADQFTDGNTYTREEEVKLRWKIDLRLVPMLWFNVTLAAMDKVTTSTAALYGFRTDTGLTGDRYSWVGSAFYVSPFFLPRAACMC